jgi:adenosylhomocysteinase
MSITRELAITNRRGLHARASAKFVKCVEAFDAEVTVSHDGQTVPGTSILGLMMLAAARKEIAIAETEMPGLMAAREEFGAEQPLKGAKIAGSLHMTIQTAVLIQTLEALGAEVQWVSCNIYSTQDHAAAAIAANGTPVWAYKGETLVEYWDYTDRLFHWHDGTSPNLILDDGGDATLYLVLGEKAEADPSILDKPSSEEETALFAQIKKRMEASPGWFVQDQGWHQGRVGRDDHRRQPPLPNGKTRRAAVPGNQRQRQRHQVEVRQQVWLPGSLVDAIRRGTDVMMAGKVAFVVRLWRCRQRLGCLALRLRRTRLVSEIDPICALQAAMDGYEVVTMEEAAPKFDIFVTATGNKDIITVDHMRAMKDMAIVCNIGHFDNEIQVEGLKNFEWTTSSRRST